MFSILCTTLSVQAQDRTTLHVWLADGTTTDILLYTRPLVTFKGDKVVITSPVATFTYDAKDVLRFTYSGTGTAISHLLGDVNGDGRISITDAVYVVNYVLKLPAANFHADAADVNGDGHISITDAVMIVNMILNQGDSSFVTEGEEIILDGNVKSSEIQLFSEDGKRRPVSLSSVNGRSSLSLKSLPAGVYQLKVNGRTSKIVKR